MRIESVGIIAVLLGLCVACGPHEPAKNPRFDLQKKAAPGTRQLTLGGPPGLPSVVVAELGSGDSEVHFARNGDKGLIVARAAGKWASGTLRVTNGDGGAVDDDPQLVEIAAAPAQSGPAALRPHGGGFVFVWTAAVSTGQEIWTVALDARGVPTGKPRSAGHAYENVTWVSALSPPRSPTVVLWETENSGRQAIHLGTMPRAGDASTKLHQVGELTREARGWQAATGPLGTAIAWVDGEPGQVRVVIEGADGKRTSPMVLTGGPTALADVHVVGLEDRFVVGWTDTALGDHHVHVAQVGAAGKAMAPAHPVLTPVGGQALVSLTASEDMKRVLVAWERDLGVAMSPRRIQLSLLDAAGKLLPEGAEIDIFSDEAMPDIVGDGAGFAALTLGPMALSDEKSADPPLLGPVFVRLFATLGARAAEPIRVAELKHQSVGMEGVPRLVYGLHCNAGVCTVLARGEGKPALLAVVSLPIRSSSWRAPTRTRAASKPPMVTALTTVAEVNEPIADVAVATLADGRVLLAWVTATLGGGPDGDGATLAYRFLDGGKPGPIHTLSNRAIASGGVDVVALPAGAPGKAAAVIGWSGPNNGSQVFATVIDHQGGKVRQKTVTQIVRAKGKSGAPNEVYDVDVALDGHDNLLFAWSDSRDDNPEIYVARVNYNLQKNKRDQRVTTSAGPSIEPQLWVTQDGVLLAWSDADKDGGAADIFVTELDGTTLLARSPQRVDASDGHSRSPRWDGSRGALTLSWLDEADGETPSALRLMAVDNRGNGLTAAKRVRTTTNTAVTSRWLSCDVTTCRGLVSASDGTLLQLALFESPRESGAPVAAAVTTVLGNGTKQDLLMTSPASAKDSLFFVQDTAGGGARLRHLTVTW